MADDIEIGVDDLSTVACAAVRERLSAIEFDGAPVPVRIGQAYPQDQKDLPVFLVHSPSEVYTQGAGRHGNRMERIDVTINVTLVVANHITQVYALEQKVGRVRAQVKELFAADPHLKFDGRLVATDLRLQRVNKGLAPGGSKTNFVSQLQYGCTIHAREGARLPAHF